MYSLFIGRFQCLPPHKGHQAMIGKLLTEGKKVLIAIRDTPIDKDNPYTLDQRLEAFNDTYEPEIKSGKMKIIGIPDIEEVVWGRGVGWGRREIRLDKETEAVSATKIRKNSLVYNI